MTVSRATHAEPSHHIMTDIMNANLITLLGLHRAVRWDVSFVNHELWDICVCGGGEGSKGEDGQPFEDQHCESELSF